MQILKKTISAAMAMALLVCLLPVAAFAAENTLQEQIDNGSKNIVLTEAVVLENDLTLPEDVTLTIQAGGSVIVPQGKKLTIRGNVMVEDGGVLDVAGTYEIGKGIFVYQYYGKNAVINGVSKDDLGLRFDVYNADDVKKAVSSMPDEEYGRYDILICESVTLPCDITIPANAKLHLADKELTLTVPLGRMVVNYGELHIGAKHTAKNYGVIDNYGTVEVGGKLINEGIVYLDQGTSAILRSTGCVINNGEAVATTKVMLGVYESLPEDADIETLWQGEFPKLPMKITNKHVRNCGDVNGDGKINAKDATLILQKSVGVLKDTAKFCGQCAEVSGDGKLNAKDSTLILQFSVGLRTDFPAAK